MEKVILSNGQEFDLVPGGIDATKKDCVTFTFVPGEHTVEQLMEMWANNSKITVKNGKVSMQTFENFTKCNYVSIIKDYKIDTVPVCPKCKMEVDFFATECKCGEKFEGPTMKETRGTVCVVRVHIPDINDRMTDAENAIEGLISSSLLV